VPPNFGATKIVNNEQNKNSFELKNDKSELIGDEYSGSPKIGLLFSDYSFYFLSRMDRIKELFSLLRIVTHISIL